MAEESDNQYICTKCSKLFATRSNLKRHMENPNIHNMPYERSRDQKRWQGHARKISSRAETTERMRKWRAQNKEKNKQNDLRCRVYRIARQKFGKKESEEKNRFIEEEINKRTRRITIPTEQDNHHHTNYLNELPFYCAPLDKIELPSIRTSKQPIVKTEVPINLPPMQPKQ
ncbi:hypothetical protein A0J61_01327 [Choanephora cucurbitarum]|uniref:C2H2-type domain-containing protein n=1 Tax=Choanephora cucurbitarum TaxID=101091 RepID=A0A1C7NNS1_9FUNG|nr:hypothetical protein A0J61_01327 [Choanephora cucurbitarum]